MDLDCCSTLNRKDSKKKKIALPDPKKITPASSEKTEHPKIVQCGNILCNMFEFPFDKVNKIAGMDITFVTNAKTDKEAKSLLNELGLPFKKN